MKPTSRIGVRAVWRCAKCAATRETHEIIAIVPEPAPLTPPPGWTVQEFLSYCENHDARNDSEQRKAA